MWYIATSASVVSGQDVVEVLAGDDVSSISSGSALIFEDGTPVEVLEAYETTGGSFIKLASNWPYTTKTAQPLLVYPTSSGLAEATAALKLYLDNIQVASTVEAQAGTNDTKIMTALKTKQAIDFNTGTAAAADVTTSPTDTTAGRLLKVGDFGLGLDGSSDTGTTISNLDSFDNPSGMFIVASGTSGTKPDGLVGNAVLTHKIFTPDRQSQFWHTCSGNGDIFIRELPTRAQGWTEWKKVYHSGNTNFNKIIGDVAGRQLGAVIIRNSTTAYFLKDISGFTSRPSSITVTGTYRIVRANNGVSVITGIQASDITLENFTSNTRLNLRISNIDTSAMNADDYYELYSDVDNTLIEVNP